MIIRYLNRDSKLVVREMSLELGNIFGEIYNIDYILERGFECYLV